ncbi:DUF3299 domain-containing protein [Psychromonas arctica]|uniref:DUF3299 domain-containing protein n=1 Tax=Psychromonas arctica TaxID=168275 RepID=A0ABU9HGD6_9GAMM
MKKYLLILLLGLTSAMQAQAQPMKIDWQDLQGKVEPYQDPFGDLTEDQLYNLSVYGRITEMKKVFPSYKLTDAMLKEAEDAKAQLIKEKVDIDEMFAQRDIIMEKRKKASLVTNDLLANREIEMSGYMLALEFDNGEVSEFLLVPTIGACSHKPVPPANQLIYVKAKQSIAAGSPYMPIKITGTLRVTPSTQDLYLVDGKKQIKMAYSLDGAIVEPFIATH